MRIILFFKSLEIFKALLKVSETNFFDFIEILSNIFFRLVSMFIKFTLLNSALFISEILLQFILYFSF